MNTFSGFSEKSLLFLDALKDNNSKDWFDAHKADYLTLLREPALAFIADLGHRLAQISTVTVDLRTNGSGTLMRINRDTRFSKDKNPYKTNISGLFWDGVGKKTENSAFGFQLESQQLLLMVGMFQFPKRMLGLYREAIINEKLGTELQFIIKSLDDTYELKGKHYKKVPRGFDADHPRAELLLYKGLYVSPPPLTGSVLQSPELINLCMTHFENLAALQNWLDRVKREI